MSLATKKFVYNGSEKDEAQHWQKCENDRIPFITVTNKNEHEVEIFYDITNISSDLERISDKVKKFYTTYLEFLNLDVSSAQEYFDEFYFFRFKIKTEYHIVLTEKLFDFLVKEVSN